MQNNKSEQSTTFEVLSDPNYLQCIEKLKQQNQYLKQALTTAETLIANYQQQNNRLEMDNKILNSKLRRAEGKYHELSSKLENIEDQSRDLSIIKDCQQHQIEQVDKLNKKIAHLVDVQVNYEQRITELQKKITILQHSNNDKKVSAKQQFILNFDMPKEGRHTVTHKQHKKHKNLNDLRSLHMKLKNKESLSDRLLEKPTGGKKLVERVFSKDKIATAPSVFSTDGKRKHHHHEGKYF